MARPLQSTETKGFSLMREARVNKGLTQLELAKLTGISLSSIRDFESMRSMPSLGRAVDICKILNISLEDILKVK